MVLFSKCGCWLGWKDDSGNTGVPPSEHGVPHTQHKGASRGPSSWCTLLGAFPAHPRPHPQTVGGCLLCTPFPHLLSPHTAGSTKYFGTAKARYDFCARDRSELSLKEGDIIKILNKKGQQGWWRGEIYGRVSQGGVWEPQGKGVG